jgi:hypothetical protein
MKKCPFCEDKPCQEDHCPYTIKNDVEMTPEERVEYFRMVDLADFED